MIFLINDSLFTNDLRALSANVEGVVKKKIPGGAAPGSPYFFGDTPRHRPLAALRFWAGSAPDQVIKPQAGVGYQRKYGNTVAKPSHQAEGITSKFGIYAHKLI